MFVNLTPHEIHEVTTDFRLPSSGVARICMESRVVRVEAGIPISQSVPVGAITGLPAPVQGTTYIVSALCLNAIDASRTDCVAPGDVVRNELGTVIGCRGFRQK